MLDRMGQSPMIRIRHMLSGALMVLAAVQSAEQGAGPGAARRQEGPGARQPEDADPPRVAGPEEPGGSGGGEDGAKVHPVDAALDDLALRMASLRRNEGGHEPPIRASEWAARAKAWGQLHRELERLNGPKLSPTQKARRAAFAARARFEELTLERDPFAHDPGFWVDLAAARVHPGPPPGAPLSAWGSYGKHLAELAELFSAARASLRSAPRESIDLATGDVRLLAEILTDRIPGRIAKLQSAAGAREALAAQVTGAADELREFSGWLAEELPARVEPPDPLGPHSYEALLHAATGTQESLDQVELALLTYLRDGPELPPGGALTVLEPKALEGLVLVGLGQVVQAVRSLCPPETAPPARIRVRPRATDPLDAVVLEREGNAATIGLCGTDAAAGQEARARRTRELQPAALIARLVIELFPAAVPAETLRGEGDRALDDPLGSRGLGLAWGPILQSLGAFDAPEGRGPVLPAPVGEELRRALIEECARLRAGIVLHARRRGRDEAQRVLVRSGGFDSWTAAQEILALERDPTRGMAGWIALEWGEWLTETGARTSPKGAVGALWKLAAEVPGIRAGFLEPVQKPPPQRR